MITEMWMYEAHTQIIKFVCKCICTCMTCITISFYLCPMHERMSPNVSICAAKTCHHNDACTIVYLGFGAPLMLREFCKNSAGNFPKVWHSKKQPSLQCTRERAKWVKSVWKHANKVSTMRVLAIGCVTSSQKQINRKILQAGIPWYPTSTSIVLSCRPSRHGI